MHKSGDIHDYRDVGGRATQEQLPRMYGQKTAPAFSALPPSVAVVCRGCMDLGTPLWGVHRSPTRR